MLIDLCIKHHLMEKGLIVVVVVTCHYNQERERRQQKYTIFFLKFFLLGLHFPFIISTHLVVVDSLFFFLLPDILSI
jgi:hypothetical protein